MKRASVALLAAAALGACHHPAPPPPAPTVECPHGTFILSDEPHPARVEVVNRTDKYLRIVIDRCLLWSRLGWVQPGRTAYLRLPARRLIRYGDKLRFHAFTEEPAAWFGAFESDLAVPVARLVISPQTALVTVSAPGTTAEDSEDGRARSEPIVARDIAGVPTVSAFSFDSYAVLTWRCAEAGPELTFSSGGHLSGDPRVTLSFGSEERSFGAWSLIQAYSDGGAAPEAVVAPFTAMIRRARAATLLVRDAPGTESGPFERYTFNTDSLDAALSGLDCLR